MKRPKINLISFEINRAFSDNMLYLALFLCFMLWLVTISVIGNIPFMLYIADFFSFVIAYFALKDIRKTYKWYKFHKYVKHLPDGVVIKGEKYDIVRQDGTSDDSCKYCALTKRQCKYADYPCLEFNDDEDGKSYFEKS